MQSTVPMVLVHRRWPEGVLSARPGGHVTEDLFFSRHVNFLLPVQSQLEEVHRIDSDMFIAPTQKKT